MGALKKEKEPFLSIVEAVETLSSIADMDFEKDIGVIPDSDQVLQEDNISYRTVHALQEHDEEEALGLAKEVFKVVLDYLKNYYKDDNRVLTDPRTIDGVKAIMILVGDAAKKLDHFANKFYTERAPCVTKLKEYRDLQKFYQSRVSKKIDERKIGKWILGISGKLETESKKVTPVRHKGVHKIDSKHIFVDLDSVKKDTEYELFYLRKEDGSRFFNPRLIRNMKLVSDFGNYFSKAEDNDPLLNLELWKDRCAQESSTSLLRMLGSRLDRFFHDTARFRKRELTGIVNNALMALILSSHVENLITNSPIKSSHEYFLDFLDFLWEALHCREYEKMLVYPPRQGDRLANCLMETVHALCRGFFIHLRGYQEMVPVLHELLSDSPELKSRSDKVVSLGTLWQRLSQEYEDLSHKMKLHPNGPLKRTLEALEEGRCNEFAPLHQGNHPISLYSIYCNDHKIASIRIPSPTEQETIKKAQIKEMFHGFLRACEKDVVAKKHLIFNLQDRTSWMESARCQVIEGLSDVTSFRKHVCVVTVAADTQFYHQTSPYHDDSQYKSFKTNFMEQVRDDDAGFYFPVEVREAVFPEFFDSLIDAVHRIFFNQKKKLSHSERLDFISIAYFFLAMKVLEVTHPDSFSMTCKDAIDVGGSFNMLMVSMLKLINHSPFSQSDIDCLHYLAYIPPLTIRERLMIPDRFQRVVSVIRHVEGLQNEYGAENFSVMIKEAISPLYETPILHSSLVPPHE